MPLALLLRVRVFHFMGMSDESRPVKLAKWPFYLADIVLSGVVFFVLYQLGTFEGTSDLVIVAVCLAVAAGAAWISILPWLKEHDASTKLTESTNLKGSLEQIKGVEKVAELIRQSNAQWQAIQDTSSRTVNSAREITEKMRIEAEEFMKFMAQANDQERGGLRLEVEKLRRMEGDWIKVVVGMLDHTYALFRAAERSGQQGLVGQLGQFQNACRDLARRMGLAPFFPAVGESFDARGHQLTDAKVTPPEGARVLEVLAGGFSYQGQLLRRALVTVNAGTAAAGLESSSERARAGEERLAADGPDQNEIPEAPSGDSGAPTSIETDQGADPAESAAGLEVFEDLSQLEPDPEPAPARSEEDSVTRSDEDESSGSTIPNRQTKKQSPQDELPF